MFAIWNWLLTVTGTTGGTYWYNWWSGFGSCLTEFAIIAFVWKKVNCHAAGCYRVGLHRVAGTHYITCRKHHPEHDGSSKATAAEIKRAHEVAQYRR